MIWDFQELYAECELVYPKIKKKKCFWEVQEFWRKNENKFDSFYRDWINDHEGVVFKFVKDYSSILLRYMITSAQYDWNVRSDLEYIYNNYLKNIEFWGKYIIDSYIKIANYNNLDQLKKDEEYIQENIIEAKKWWVQETTISELCKSYISISVITWIYNEAKESKLWDFLDNEWKKYFTDMKTDDISDNVESLSSIQKQIAEFDALTQDTGHKPDTTDFTSFDDDATFDNEIDNSRENWEELINEDTEEFEEEYEEEPENETQSESKTGDEESKVETSVYEVPETEIVESDVEEPQIIEPDVSETSIDDFDIEEGVSRNINVVVISSDTQMSSVRRAYSQNWLDEQAKLKWWPANIDFKKNVRMIDWFKEAPNTSIKTIAKYDLIIIWQNDHLLKDMPKDYTAWQKKDWWIKKCLLDIYNLWEWRVYFPEKNKRPDLSITSLRYSLCDFMDRRSKNKTAL